MPSCKEVVHLLSKEQRLSVWQRLRLFPHLLICSNCSLYSKQISALTKSFKNLFLKRAQTDPQEIQQLKAQILKSALENDSKSEKPDNKTET
jgi:hypothetical protein